MVLNVVIMLIAINNSIVLSGLTIIMFTETERRLHEHRQKSFIWYIFGAGARYVTIKDLIQVVHL